MMDLPEMMARQSELTYLLRLYDSQYAQGKPTVSDGVYDALKHEWRRSYQLQEERTLASLEPPVGYPPSTHNTITHLNPMRSLHAVYSPEEVAVYFGVDVATGKLKMPLVAQYKMDGIACSLTYIDGVFTHGSTRGDGLIGDNITDNLVKTATFPRRLKCPSKGILEVRGELYLPKAGLASINEQLGEPTYSNCRNTVAGMMRRHGLCAMQAQEIRFAAYESFSDVVEERPKDEYIEEVTCLGRQGFSVLTGYTIESTDDMKDFIQSVEAKREELPFDIDGIVFKVNDLKVRQELGYTSHHPKWAVAFKFAPKEAVTRLTDVKWQVGRSGLITPVAILDRVEIGGVFISRATLHNMANIGGLGICVPCSVVVVRAGDVIPDIYMVLDEDRGLSVCYPSQCPNCGSETVMNGSQTELRCNNIACSSVEIGKLLHFTSDKGVNVLGLGESILAELVGNKVARNPADLYGMDLRTWCLQVGDVRGQMLYQRMQESKEQPLHKFVAGLGIPNVGDIIATRVAASIKSFSELPSLINKSVCDEIDAGPVVRASVHAYMNIRANLAMVEQMISIGCCPNANRPVQQGPLSGEVVFVTGTLSNVSRAKFESFVESRGGVMSANPSEKVTIAVIGDKSSKAKVDSLRRLNVPMTSFIEFNERYSMKK